MPRVAISSARFSAPFICGPDTRTGPRRSRSSSETRSPGRTVSRESSTARCPTLSNPYSVSHSRWFAISRTEATSLVSVVTPGGSTRRSRNQLAAASNNDFGPSPSSRPARPPMPAARPPPRRTPGTPAPAAAVGRSATDRCRHPLFRADMGAVHAGPRQLAGRVQLGEQDAVQLVEDSCLLPPLQAAPAGLSRAEPQLQRQELPGYVVVEDVEDALEKSRSATGRGPGDRSGQAGNNGSISAHKSSSTVHGRVLTASQTAESSDWSRPTSAPQQDRVTSS